MSETEVLVDSIERITWEFVLAEREACARLAEEMAARYDSLPQSRACEAVAKAIRARSDGTP